MTSTSYPTVAPVTNCEGYVMFHELPSWWCENLSQWAICGIADGVIDGPGYGCEFRSTNTGYCKDKDGDDECLQFLQDSVIALPTSNPTTVASVTNCEGYLMYHELPSDWCEYLTSWAICGIADGVIDGSGYGCTLRVNETGFCKDKDGNDQCTQFLQGSDFEPKGIESEDFDWKNLFIVLRIGAIFLSGCCLLWMWKMLRKDKRRNQHDVAVEEQQRIEYGEVAHSTGMSVFQQQSFEGIVVEPTPEGETVNSLHSDGRPVWHSSENNFDTGRSSVVGENQAGEDLAPPDPAACGYKAPLPNYEPPPPDYEAPPPYHEACSL